MIINLKNINNDSGQLKDNNTNNIIENNSDFGNVDGLVKNQKMRFLSV